MRKYSAKEKLDIVNKYLSLPSNNGMELEICYVPSIKKHCLKTANASLSDCEDTYHHIKDNGILNIIFFDTPDEAIDNFVCIHPEMFRDLSWSGLEMIVAIAKG